jgi:hypothetical protein
VAVAAARCVAVLARFGSMLTASSRASRVVEEGWGYFMQRGSDGSIKIGTSFDVRGRLEHLSAEAGPLELIGVMQLGIQESPPGWKGLDLHFQW